MRPTEQAELIKKSLCYANSSWNTWDERTKIEYSRELAQQYKQITDDYWKDYVWKAMTFYQRILSYIITALKE